MYGRGGTGVSLDGVPFDLERCGTVRCGAPSMEEREGCIGDGARDGVERCGVKQEALGGGKTVLVMMFQPTLKDVLLKQEVCEDVVVDGARGVARICAREALAPGVRVGFQVT